MNTKEVHDLCKHIVFRLEEIPIDIFEDRISYLTDAISSYIFAYNILDSVKQSVYQYFNESFIKTKTEQGIDNWANVFDIMLSDIRDKLLDQQEHIEYLEAHIDIYKKDKQSKKYLYKITARFPLSDTVGGTRNFDEILDIAATDSDKAMIIAKQFIAEKYKKQQLSIDDIEIIYLTKETVIIS